jgi:hypothetical protein
MALDKISVFQTDSKILTECLITLDNYLIEYNQNIKKEYCIVYFSSNDLYYPNNENSFRESIINKNRFEWYGSRINIGYKHIFIRDIQKQWYLGGINAKINTPQKLYDFLKVETTGYKIILLGSSAGGFASVIFGQMLKAKKIYSFNGQFEILSLLKRSSESIDPLVFRNIGNNEILKFYDSRNFITSPKTIFYFHSLKSGWDIEQAHIIKDYGLYQINFNSNNHGLPFYRFNLNYVLNLDFTQLVSFSKKSIHPFFFSIRLIGFYKTIYNYCLLSINYAFKLAKRKVF